MWLKRVDADYFVDCDDDEIKIAFVHEELRTKKVILPIAVVVAIGDDENVMNLAMAAE